MSVQIAANSSTKVSTQTHQTDAGKRAALKVAEKLHFGKYDGTKVAFDRVSDNIYFPFGSTGNPTDWVLVNQTHKKVTAAISSLPETGKFVRMPRAVVDAAIKNDMHRVINLQGPVKTEKGYVRVYSFAKGGRGERGGAIATRAQTRKGPEELLWVKHARTSQECVA